MDCRFRRRRAAIAIIAAVVWVNERPQGTAPPPPPVIAATPAPTVQPATPPPAPEAAARPADLTAREQLAYSAARGNLSALLACVNNCTVCAYQAAAIHAWPRQRQQLAHPVAAGVLIYVNELAPGGDDIRRLRNAIAAGKTDVAPVRGDPDFYALQAWTPGAASGLWEAFRFRRAIRVMNGSNTPTSGASTTS